MNMKLHAKGEKPDFRKDDTVILFLTEEYQKETDVAIPPELSFVREGMDLGFFKGKGGEAVFLPFRNHPNVVIQGIGKKADVTRESLRNAAAGVTGLCVKKKIKSVHVLLPLLDKPDAMTVLVSLAEGLSLANYSFNRYKSRKEENQAPLENIYFFAEKSAGNMKLLREVEILAENTHLCRDLVNETSDRHNPVAIAAEARRVARMRGVSCSVFGRREIERMKMGLLVAVSRGSVYPPQLVVLKYRGNPRGRKSVALVGKGITFDSGGLNLKPSGHIEDMRSDMAGAAACLYALRAAAEMKLKKNITVVIPLCENMLSSNSFRPGDVFLGYNGKSVEIGNTDAEGRLILADALAYTEDKLKPDYIIDIATLTGAALICFGEIIAGLLTADDGLAGVIHGAGEETGDRVWRMPLYREYDDDMKSDIADIRNVAAGRNAGTIMGAVFLKNFVRKTPWAHLDIAGTSWYSKQRGYKPKNATGFGVRLMVSVIRALDI